MTTPSDPQRVLLLLPDAEDTPATRELLGVLDDAGGAWAGSAAAAWAGGSRLADLRARVPVGVVSELGGGAAASLERLLLRARLREPGLGVRRRRLGLRGRFDAVYLTSPAAAPLLRYLPAQCPPVVVMVPKGEMTETAHEPLSDADRDLLLARADRFVVASLLDRLERLGVAAERIVRIGGPLDGEAVAVPSAGAAEAARARLGIPAGTEVLAGTGPLVWQGGADLFVRLLWMLRARRGRDVVGVWVGDAGEDLERRQLDHDIDHMGLADAIHLRPATDAGALAAADVHVVTTREVELPEPYRAAGELGQPLVGFRTDVLDRFAETGAGALVDFLDFEALADAAEALLDDADRRGGLAATVRARFEEWHVPPARTRFLLETVRGAR